MVLIPDPQYTGRAQSGSAEAVVWPSNCPVDRTKQLLEAECKDGDKILALFPHLQRTEGGRLPVARLVNEICDLAARCKRAETRAAMETTTSQAGK